MRPDIGWLVKSVKEKGIDEVANKIEMELGVPISPMLCQRLKSSKAMIKKWGGLRLSQNLMEQECRFISGGVVKIGR